MARKFQRLVSLDSDTLYPVKDRTWHILDEVAAKYTVCDRTPARAVALTIGNADAVLTNKTPITARTIAECPGIRYIGVLATGYNIVDTAAATAAGITVCNVPAYSTASVAQTAVSLLLALTQHVEKYGQLNRRGKWCRCEDFTYRTDRWQELAGKTMGIVGFGNTGSATAAIAAAMGMRIAVFTSKSQKQLPQGYCKVSLDELFAESDVVSLHCPLTQQTRNIVNADRLARMKREALLLNTARGPLVDEQALADALNGGIIAGAGLDVLCDEPPMADNPLIKARNCIITPHIAWSSEQARQRLFHTTIANIKAFLKGKPQNTVR